MEKLRPEHEPLLILKFFREPHDLITKTTFFARFRRNPFEKIIVFGKFLLIAEIYFTIFFLHNNFISEIYFLTIKKVSEIRDKLGDLYTIY
jgi:hypothetical protein